MMLIKRRIKVILNLNMNTNEINKEGNVVTFDYNNHKVRTIIKDAETWWILKDVCEVLDINNSKMVAARLENDEKSRVTLEIMISKYRIEDSR